MKCNACTRHLLTLIRIKKLGKLSAYEVACNSPMRFHKENITIFIILIKTLCTPFSPTSNIKEGSPRQHFNEFDKLQLHSTNWEHTSSSRFLELETYIIRYNQSSAKVKRTDEEL